MKQIINEYRFENILKETGFIRLTGEACGIGLRTLYDLTDEAVRFVEEFFGIKIERGNNWNNSQKQVASIMLPYSFMRDIVIYRTLLDWEHVVDVRCSGDSWSCNMLLVSDTKEDFLANRREMDEHPMVKGKYTVWHREGTAPGGMRNRHEFSGRTD